jgi:hypothetical protein
MLNTSLQKISSSNSDREIECVLRFSPPIGAKLGQIHGNLILRWEGKEGRKLVLPCQARIVSEWVSKPAEIVLREINPDEALKFTMRIQNRKPLTSSLAKSRVTVVPENSVKLTSEFNGDGWIVTGFISPKRDYFRYTRTRKTLADEVEHVCDNRQQIVSWQKNLAVA